GVVVSLVLGSLSFMSFGLAIGGWNPNSIPFFFLVMIISAIKIGYSWLNSKSSICWYSLLGLSCGILLGLHSTSLFIAPIFLVVFLIYAISKTKNWPGLITALVSLAATLIPYLIGELHSGLANSRAIVHYLIGQTEPSGLTARLT